MEIWNGVPLFDQHGRAVNAHGAGVLEENGRYYLFGEYKTDDVNRYNGFSCYSTADFSSWRFEGLALGPQESGLLGPGRIGERVKVLRCPSTGRYVMLMHTDDLRYCDPVIGLAVGERIDGEFTFVGPLLYQGQPIRRWDMGTFVDDDGTAYLMTHEGDIYRLSEDYTCAEELVAKDVAPGGESPACFKKEGVYYLLLSNKTSWERNDNYYLTAPDLHGPWTRHGLFCPEGSLTFNSQCSFVFHVNGRPVYLGDRWSFPRQASAATLVMLPLEAEAGRLSIRRYMPVWSPDTGEEIPLRQEQALSFCSNVKGEVCSISFGGGRLLLFGETDCRGGYADVRISDADGNTVHTACVDFYSLAPDAGLRYASPVLPKGGYTLTLTVSGCGGEWFKKDGTRFGSTDTFVRLTGWSTIG